MRICRSLFVSALLCSALTPIGVVQASPPTPTQTNYENGHSFVQGNMDKAGFELTRFSPVARPHDSSGLPANDVVRMAYTYPMGQNALSVSSSQHDRESRYSLGLRTKSTSIDVFSGRGDSFSRLEQGSSQLDPYFFHGGTTQDFSYQGAALDLAVSNAVNLQFGIATIDATNLDRRTTHYAGIGYKGTNLGVFSVARENDATASGLNLSVEMGGGIAQFQQIAHESGARFRALNLARTVGDGDWYGLSFESGRNPLYQENNESRIMFRLGGIFGQPPLRLNANETVDNGEEPTEQKSRRGTGIALAAGTLVAVGIASSSGSDSKDNAIRIAGQHNAARTILNQVNPVSVRQNREHGGWVYRNGDGTFGYTKPVAGDVDGVDIGSKSSIPGGTHATASYHTHAGPDPRYDNENFSPVDILSDNLDRVDGYLGTPAGFMKYHEYRTQNVTTLGRINN